MLSVIIGLPRRRVHHKVALLEAGADPAWADAEGKTPFLEALVRLAGGAGG